MERQTRQRQPGSSVRLIRRMLLIFLAAIYVMVGIAGEVMCAGETLAAATSLTVNAVPDKSDEGSKKTPDIVEHCYTCVPLLMPAPVLVAEPSAEPVKLTFVAPTFLVEDAPRLDPPPPKHLS